ncbi:MAG: DUF1847 domain-containing protein [Bacillota bacterium]|nr:DUF1847 domain-containing protein [Bacillota bacterium]
MYYCALCSKKSCRTDSEDYPNNCPTLEEEKLEEIKEKYQDPLDRKISYNAAKTEKEGYCRLTRVEETMLFFEKMQVKKIGLAFCSGLMEEGRILYDIFTKNGFQVSSVMCKNGSIEKSYVGLEKEDYLRPLTREVMCNPIGQAEFLNEAKTDYNVLLGLCVGHDSLFLKHSQAPVTVIGVKDRVLGHNPIAALYQADKYYKNKLYPKKEKGSEKDQ